MDLILILSVVFIAGLLLGVGIEHYFFKSDNSNSEQLNLIIQKLNNMPTKAEFDALRDEFSTAFTNIADDIRRLTEALESGDLTADEEAQVFADLRALADRANAIAGTTPEPPTEPPVEG